MSNAFRDYQTTGEPDPSRARGAALTDLAIGVLAGILIWPFPVMRVVFRGLVGSEGLAWAIHVPVLLVALVVIAWLTGALVLWLGHRTVGMYFADLGFESAPRPGRALSLSLAWTLAGLVSIFASGGARGFTARHLCSTKGG